MFPTWLKVVCTVRSSMPSVVKCLPFHKISLDKCALDERVKKDIVDYIRYRYKLVRTCLNLSKIVYL